ELFRALQGVGGAVLFATGTPLLRAEFSGAALPRALGAFGATLGGASAIGPLAGGVLTDTLGWPPGRQPARLIPRIDECLYRQLPLDALGIEVTPASRVEATRW